MPQNLDLKDDEIDLRELFATLWYHKFLITLLTGLSIFLSGYYALTTEKKFTAHAKFQIEESGNNSGFNLSGELSALASLAGISAGSSLYAEDSLLERVIGREYITKCLAMILLGFSNDFSIIDIVDIFYFKTIVNAFFFKFCNVKCYLPNLNKLF